MQSLLSKISSMFGSKSKQNNLTYYITGLKNRMQSDVRSQGFFDGLMELLFTKDRIHEQFIEADGLLLLNETIGSFYDSIVIIENSLHLIEKLCREESGLEAVLSSGILQTIIRIWRRSYNTHEEITMDFVKLLLRIVGCGGGDAIIRESKVLRPLLSSLEDHVDKKKLLISITDLFPAIMDDSQHLEHSRNFFMENDTISTLIVAMERHAHSEPIFISHIAACLTLMFEVANLPAITSDVLRMYVRELLPLMFSFFRNRHHLVFIAMSLHISLCQLPTKDLVIFAKSDDILTHVFDWMKAVSSNARRLKPRPHQMRDSAASSVFVPTRQSLASRQSMTANSRNSEVSGKAVITNFGGSKKWKASTRRIRPQTPVQQQPTKLMASKFTNCHKAVLALGRTFTSKASKRALNTSNSSSGRNIASNTASTQKAHFALKSFLAEGPLELSIRLLGIGMDTVLLLCQSDYAFCKQAFLDSGMMHYFLSHIWYSSSEHVFIKKAAMFLIKICEISADCRKCFMANGGVIHCLKIVQMVAGSKATDIQKMMAKVILGGFYHDEESPFQVSMEIGVCLKALVFELQNHDYKSLANDIQKVFGMWSMNSAGILDSTEPVASNSGSSPSSHKLTNSHHIKNKANRISPNKRQASRR